MPFQKGTDVWKLRKNWSSPFKGKTYEEKYGKERADEIKKKQSLKKIENPTLNIIPWWIKRNLPNPATLPNAKKKNSEKHKGKSHNKGKSAPWVRERNLKNNPVWIPGVKEKIRETVLKKLDLCLDYSKRKPNYKEKFLDTILQKNFPNEFKFVGDGKIKINGKNPDFINCNGKKLIIEFFGRRWHELEDEFIRKAIFSQYGFSTLVIWGEELKQPEKVVERIREFMEVKNEK